MLAVSLILSFCCDLLLTYFEVGKTTATPEPRRLSSPPTTEKASNFLFITLPTLSASAFFISTGGGRVDPTLFFK